MLGFGKELEHYQRALSLLKTVRLEATSLSVKALNYEAEHLI
jgi:hypothetical protein